MYTLHDFNIVVFSFQAVDPQKLKFAMELAMERKRSEKNEQKVVCTTTGYHTSIPYY